MFEILNEMVPTPSVFQKKNFRLFEGAKSSRIFGAENEDNPSLTVVQPATVAH